MAPHAQLDASALTLASQRLGPLPIINHFLERLGLEALLDRFVQTNDPRTKIPNSTCLGVLLRSIIVHREPIYRQHETVCAYANGVFGVSARQAKHLVDDSIGRALDRLFLADRGALLTACVVAAGKVFGLSFKELHNDSTSVRFCGQYPLARGRAVRGKRAPFIVAPWVG